MNHLNYNQKTDVNESRFEDIQKLHEITEQSMIYELLGDEIILTRFQHNVDYLFDRVVDVAVLCWANKDEHGDVLQHTPIKFKVSDDDIVTFAIPLNRFMMTLAFLRPLYPYLTKFDIKEVILDDSLTSKKRQQIQDSMVRIMLEQGVGMDMILENMARMSLDLKELMLVFSHADMQVFTAGNLFLDHYQESEIIRDINNTEYPASMQTVDIIEENKKKYQLLEEEMLKRGNPFFIDNKYTKIIKPKQMEELYINFSQIPDGKNIIPVIMNGNGFRAGYSDPAVFYAGTIASRVPDIMNGEYMGQAGYFNRNLMILTYGTISKTVFDCGSENPIPIPIDEVALEMMDGRYYYETKESRVLKILDGKDTSLIGKTLWFRSPCTCNLNEDCCHVCYGTKALKVGTLPGGFIYTTELMTSRVSQNILSAKHLLKANSERINFNENFDKYFIYESSAIYPISDKRFDIYIPDNYQDTISEKFTFYVTKDLIPVSVSNYANIIITDELLDTGKIVTIDDKEYTKISSYKILEDEFGGIFCNIIPINIMMTQKYMDIKRLFETEMNKFEKVEDIVVKLMHLTHGIIPILSTHGEIMIGKHLRDVNNKMLRPNFLEPDVPYTIYTLKTALQNSEAVTTALAFEQTNHHLVHRIFDERNEINRVGPKSFEDYLFGYDVT